ncbi:sensor histidine kinase [Vagococcus intermedius]|uniref:histidine kinase n=1 Tax=Vagococcus intermedius TaxID=2991418 RepID=A0AAF0CTY2_9ENTE|nr:histidine kinase N-terminal domain-containing protein [Vagococcus intermedius]WEG72784.1 sensor histidine kinase [Vagococcus intermedius]WEG74869.1 sensor histidine kinase [Vagococcus intermedius]
MIDKNIRQLCQKYSDLSAENIAEIIKAAHQLEESKQYENEDVFIDILSDVTDEAIVVYHRPPKRGTSIYSEQVVGKVAKRLNEPSVYRTFETSLKTEGLLAKTQENKMIRQKVFPIRNNRENIAVVIVESPLNEVAEERYFLFNLFKERELPEISSQSSDLPKKSHFYRTLVNKLDEGILIFDKAGYLVINNEVAESYYYHLGYLDKIKGLHYDNLSLDMTTFEQLQYLKHAERWDEVDEKEIFFGESHFNMKRFFEQDEDALVMILHDKTEVYNKEVEIITKSVAIREIHHRVKNNLQSIVSLLRIQGRRSENEEVKKALRESEARILAISTAHEILSKELTDDIPLASVLDLIITNAHRSFLSSKKINLDKQIDEKIYLNGDKTVTVALIVNELLQNSFEHGFTKEDSNNSIEIVVSAIDDDTISIIVKDNGRGYNPKKVNKNSFGLQIVISYVKDKLRGKIKINSNSNGTTTQFYFRK